MALTFVQRIKELLTGKRDIKSGVRLVINCEKLENRVALLDKGTVEEYNIERVGTSSLIGSVFKGRIRNIEQGLKAMFIDIGFDKNAFLHFWDAIPAALDGLEEINRRGSKKKKRIEAKDIPTPLPRRLRDHGAGHQRPRRQQRPARHHEHLPRRTPARLDAAQRHLRHLPQDRRPERALTPPQDHRKNQPARRHGHHPAHRSLRQTRARHIVRDLNILIDEWEQIVANVTIRPRPSAASRSPISSSAPCVTSSPRTSTKSPATTSHCRAHAAHGRAHLRRAKRRINFYQGQSAIFEHYGIQKQIDNAFYRQVWMPCGGYIVIDQTEALVSIDVNTGRNKGHKDVDKLLLETNLEAAAEVARQLRLRNMGGLIVVDFIDMKHRRTSRPCTSSCSTTSSVTRPRHRCCRSPSSASWR
jgi:ribonuclease G